MYFNWMRKVLYILAVIAALMIGLYPIVYYIADMSQGLLGSKSTTLLEQPLWHYSFYLHISLGGIALLAGATQFFKQSRSKYMKVHKLLGKTYVVSVIISSIAGLIIAFNATGGLVSELGFGILAILWFVTTIKAYIEVKNGEVSNHEKWMTRSYALCFAAVTLRIWLGLSGLADLAFNDVYPIIAWLCWVPNLIVAELIVRQ